MNDAAKPVKFSAQGRGGAVAACLIIVFVSQLQLPCACIR